MVFLPNVTSFSESIDIVRSPSLEMAACTDAGRIRPNNEDSYRISLDEAGRPVLIVADGVGGHEGGGLASRLAVDTAMGAYRDGKATSAGKRLYRAVQEANIAIYDRAVVVPELSRMGTTVVAMVVDKGTLHIAHVGDSRVYLLRGDLVRQLTKDHTVAAERLRLGWSAREHGTKGERHPDSSTLTRVLGRQLIVPLDKITVPLLNDDVLVACTDGLHNLVDDGDLLDAIEDARPEVACHRLIDMANERGSPDNVTAAVLRLKAAPPHEPSGIGVRLRKLWRR